MKRILKFFTPLVLLLCLSCAAAGCTGVMGDAIIRYDNAKQYAATSDGELNLPVKNLEVEWVSGKVEIVYYKGASVKFSEVRNDGKTETDDYTMRYLLDQTDTLHLKFAKSGVRNNNLGAKALTVQIPQNTTLNSVEVETVSAEAVVSVNADSCEIETVSGDLYCRNATYGEIEAKTVSGGITVKDVTVARKTEIDSVSGDAVASFITLPAAVDAESVSGDITLHFPDAGFSVNFDTVSGTFYSYFNSAAKPETVTGGKFTNAGSPSCDCTVSTVSGDLTLTRFSAE